MQEEHTRLELPHTKHALERTSLLLDTEPLYKPTEKVSQIVDIVSMTRTTSLQVVATIVSQGIPLILQQHAGVLKYLTCLSKA